MANTLCLFLLQALVNGVEYDTVVIKRTLGTPERVIPNSWTERIL
ncbi:MAG TPA: hypothetical protein VNM45_06955 [Bacillus sp. (in: firmicutes)]|nr:hypothetical protein [Bacillus sp. (in: firmicutes)]